MKTQWPLVVCLSLVVACICTAGCSKVNVHMNNANEVDLVATNYGAIDTLLSGGVKLDREDRVLVATSVDLNNLTRTASFGRVSGEHFGARLSQRGHSVVYIKLRENAMVVNDSGEFLLSREMRNLGTAYKAKAALVSTYTRAETCTYVSVRLVSTDDNVVLGSCDFELPNTKGVSALLTDYSAANSSIFR